MANLIAHQQVHLANSEVPSANTASALPADIKTAGKNGKEIQKDAKSASEAFAANLKEQTETQAKKDALKKDALKNGLSQAPAQNLPTPVPQIALAKNAQAEILVDGKLGKGGKLALAEKGGGVALPAGAQTASSAKAAQSKALQALLAEHAHAKTDASSAKLTPVTAKNNLTPLQQMMLSESMANKRMAASPQVGPSGAVANAELSQALESLGGPNAEIDHDFEVESLALSGAAGKAILNGKETEAAKRAPVSKVSTSDFLDLRNLSIKNPILQNSNHTGLDLGTALKIKDGGKKDKLEALTGKEAFAGTLASRFENGPHIKTIDAPVTQGPAGKNVLSHDAIHQMTQSVNMLSQARQDGEIKIRLRPDHLGELHMSVKTQGQHVSIEIKAQNSESKKIIEASLASLKDSLGQQNLTLARIDIVNAPAHAQNAADQGMQMDMSQFRQNSGQSSDRGFDQGGNGQDLRYEEMNAPINLNAARMAGVNARAGQGLDLIA
jgi:flagellar hook-length control protein FliK